MGNNNNNDNLYVTALDIHPQYPDDCEHVEEHFETDNEEKDVGENE